MPNLNNKQKIIIGIIIFIMIGVIIYYLYTNFQKTKEEIYISTQETETTNNITKEDIEENTEEIVIHIAGAVKKEGIITIKEGKRIADAIEKAGGLKENASIKNVNLAYVLEDGQKIYIPTIEEENEKEIAIVTSGESGKMVENSSKKESKIVNINTANEEELQKIPGIGEATAQKIIEYRKENGKFKTIEELKNVSGIGESKFNQMKEYIKI